MTSFPTCVVHLFSCIRVPMQRLEFSQKKKAQSVDKMSRADAALAAAARF